MKICQVVPSLDPQHGGPSKSVLALSAALARAGHEVDLVATDETQPTTRREGTLRVSVFQRETPKRISRSSELCAYLRTLDADVFHHHALWLRTLHYTHERAVRRSRFVISPRGMMSDWAWQHHGVRKSVARRLIHPGAFEAAAGWHATSTQEEAEIRRRGFRQPICVAPNGVEAPSPAEIAAAKRHWSDACPAVGQRPVALFYSRFHAKKRVLELIDTWLAHAPRDWLLLLVGIPEEYTPDDLKRYSRQRYGAERIAVFSGLGRPAPYAVASLFLLPSHNENFGLVVAEAMAHGVPVVVTDSTPWQGVNEDGHGWCVAWEGFPAALRAATSEPVAELLARGERARTWVLRTFSWDSSARKLVDFYRALPTASA